MISITATSPSALLYSTLATFAGIRTISRSPESMAGSSSSAAAVMVNSYLLTVSFFSACSIRYTSPMEVGPFREPILTVTPASSAVSSSSGRPAAVSLPFSSASFSVTSSDCSSAGTPAASGSISASISSDISLSSDAADSVPASVSLSAPQPASIETHMTTLMIITAVFFFITSPFLSLRYQIIFLKYSVITSAALIWDFSPACSRDPIVSSVVSGSWRNAVLVSPVLS